MATAGNVQVFYAVDLDGNKHDGCPQGNVGPGSKDIVVDGLLCFLVNKLSVMTQDTLEKVITSAYKVDTIEASKKKLFTLCATSRYQGHKGEKAATLHIRDMVKVLQEKGTDIPIFVCAPEDLSELPPISFDNLDVSMLLSQIQKTQSALDVMKATVDCQHLTISDLTANSTGIDSRMKRLERQFDDPFYRDPSIPAPAKENMPTETPVKSVSLDEAKPKQGVDSRVTTSWTDVVKRKKVKPQTQLSHQPAQSQSVQKKDKKKPGLVGTAKIANITTVQTKIVNVFATKFTPDLEAATLRDYLKGKLNLQVQCRKIDTQSKRFASFQVTTECVDPKVLYDPSIWPTGAFVRRYYEPRGPRQGTEAEKIRNAEQGEVIPPNHIGETQDRGAIGGETGMPNKPVQGTNS